MPPRAKQPSKASIATKKDGTISFGAKTPTSPEDKSLDSPAKFNIPYENNKPILCQRVPADRRTPTTLIFTHGAGGGIENPATALFARGFAGGAGPATNGDGDEEGKNGGFAVVSFEGTMNMVSRVKYFHAMIEHEKNLGVMKDLVLGGRSMGARAAVVAMKEQGTKKGMLVLASYPLVGMNGEVRDKILLEIEENVEVLFVSGDKDSMCDLKQLGAVREKMKARSWMMLIKGADHGIGLKPSDAVAKIREFAGEAAARWVRGEGRGGKKTQCILRWDAHARKAVQEEWTNEADHSVLDSKRPAEEGKDEKGPAKKQRKR
jgi:predicted alpha/beta-hydrolase family hydrolase